MKTNQIINMEKRIAEIDAEVLQINKDLARLDQINNFKGELK